MASTTSTEAIIPLDGASLYKESMKTSGNSALDKDAFLNLLVAQMKYQNPLEPVSNTESIAQLAQFSALEQMTNVATAQSKSSAYSLIGKYVMGNKYTASTGKTETIYGTVSSVKQSGNDIFLVVDGVDLPLSSVSNVADPNSAALGAINNNIATNQSLNLIGKNVQAIITDSDGNLSKFIEGKVDYVKVTNGRTVLMVNDVEVFAEEVLIVSGDNKLLNTKPITATATDEKGVEHTATGVVKGIEFVENQPYLVIGNEKFAINTISDATEAINLLGKTVDTKDIKGKVDEVLLKNGVVYVTIEGKEHKIEDVRKALTNAK